MRKILTSVLSVAGLLAVVLALASSPASAATKVVVFTTPATAGEYTISWNTAGGCDPGDGTSGASGSVSVTVRVTSTAVDPDAPNVNELTGTAGTQFVTVNNDCTYKWSASLIDAASKANCEVGVPAVSLTGADASVDITLNALAADGAGCAPAGSISVTVTATAIDAAVNCTQTEIDDADVTTGPCADVGADTDTVKTDATYDAVSQGAVAKSTFTVTATPARNSHAACEAVSDDTSVEGGVNSVKLSVVGANAIIDGESVSAGCEYNIKAALPAGFAAAGKSNEAPNVPSVDADTEGTDNARTLTVTVAQPEGHPRAAGRPAIPKVVLRPTGGAPALCAAGLPDALTGRSRGGINPGSTTVELREGRFDITAAVEDTGTINDLFALDSTATACSVRATVSNLPGHCSAANPTNAVTANLADDATSNGIVFVNVVIDCSAPEPEPEPEPEMTEPEMTEPEMTEPEMTEPEMTEPEMTEPEGPTIDVPTG